MRNTDLDSSNIEEKIVELKKFKNSVEDDKSETQDNNDNQSILNLKEDNTTSSIQYFINKSQISLDDIEFYIKIYTKVSNLFMKTKLLDILLQKAEIQVFHNSTLKNFMLTCFSAFLTMYDDKSKIKSFESNEDNETQVLWSHLSTVLNVLEQLSLTVQDLKTFKVGKKVNNLGKYIEKKNEIRMKCKKLVGIWKKEKVDFDNERENNKNNASNNNTNNTLETSSNLIFSPNSNNQNNQKSTLSSNLNEVSMLSSTNFIENKLETNTKNNTLNSITNENSKQNKEEEISSLLNRKREGNNNNINNLNINNTNIDPNFNMINQQPQQHMRMTSQYNNSNNATKNQNNLNNNFKKGFIQNLPNMSNLPGLNNIPNNFPPPYLNGLPNMPNIPALGGLNNMGNIGGLANMPPPNQMLFQQMMNRNMGGIGGMNNLNNFPLNNSKNNNINPNQLNNFLNNNINNKNSIINSNLNINNGINILSTMNNNSSNNSYNNNGINLNNQASSQKKQLKSILKKTNKQQQINIKSPSFKKRNIKFSDESQIEKVKVFKQTDEPNCPEISEEEFVRIQKEILSKDNYTLVVADVRRKEINMEKENMNKARDKNKLANEALKKMIAQAFFKPMKEVDKGKDYDIAESDESTEKALIKTICSNTLAVNYYKEKDKPNCPVMKEEKMYDFCDDDIIKLENEISEDKEEIERLNKKKAKQEVLSQINAFIEENKIPPEISLLLQNKINSMENFSVENIPELYSAINNDYYYNMNMNNTSSLNKNNINMNVMNNGVVSNTNSNIGGFSYNNSFNYGNNNISNNNSSLRAPYSNTVSGINYQSGIGEINALRKEEEVGNKINNTHNVINNVNDSGLGGNNFSNNKTGLNSNISSANNFNNDNNQSFHEKYSNSYNNNNSNNNNNNNNNYNNNRNNYNRNYNRYNNSNNYNMNNNTINSNNFQSKMDISRYKTKPCNKFHSIVGCNRENKCFFIHDNNFRGTEIPNFDPENYRDEASKKPQPYVERNNYFKNNNNTQSSNQYNNKNTPNSNNVASNCSYNLPSPMNDGSNYNLENSGNPDNGINGINGNLVNNNETINSFNYYQSNTNIKNNE